MKPIKEAIEEATATGKRLLAENPGLTSVAFTLKGYEREDMNRYADENAEMTPEYRDTMQCFSMCCIPTGGVYIHIHSREVKAKIVYE